METATATKPAKLMYVKGLDNPNALQIQFRRPTPLVIAALHFVLEKNAPWVHLQTNTQGNYNLEWDQSTLIERQRAIQNMKAEIALWENPNRAHEFEVRVTERYNREAYQKLESALKDAETRLRALELASQEQLRVERLLPNSVMKTQFLGKLASILGNVYQSNLHNARSDVEAAYDALRAFVPKTEEQAIQAECEKLRQKLETQISELETVTRMYAQAMTEVHDFLQNIVAMETAQTTPTP